MPSTAATRAARSARGSRFVGHAAGFTVVELIAVLLLLGILAATATSRLVGGNAYAPVLAAQQLIALGRLAQETALTRRDAAVSLDVDRDGADWRFRVSVNDGSAIDIADEERAPLRNTAITVSNGSLAVALASGDALHLVFDGLGGLTDGAAGSTALDPSIGVAVSVSGDSTSTVCFGAAGHAYRGGCI